MGHFVVSCMIRDTAVTSLRLPLSEGVRRLTQWGGSDLARSPVTEDNHPQSERHRNQGDLKQLCNWEQNCKSTIRKLDSVFLGGMKLSNSSALVENAPLARSM